MTCIGGNPADVLLMKKCRILEKDRDMRYNVSRTRNVLVNE